MTSWHDFTSELTDEQCDELAELENFADKPATLLAIARAFAAENIAAAVLSGVEAPTGALTVDVWEHGRGDVWSRHFLGPACQAGGATVTVHGVQHSDGNCRRWIGVRGADELNPGQAEELASALVLTAHELSELGTL